MKFLCHEDLPEEIAVFDKFSSESAGYEFPQIMVHVHVYLEASVPVEFPGFVDFLNKSIKSLLYTD